MSNPTNPDGQNTRLFEDADYKPILSNWYTSKPYGFRFTPKNGQAMQMFLPINPSNLTITTHFATNIVPTLYGTVEEHSPVRYHDITIEGTTGMGPKYLEPMFVNETPNGKTQRSRFTVRQSIDNRVGGAFSKTLAIAENATVSVQLPSQSTGLQLDQTGYYAWHNLFRFLLKYKKDASSTVAREDSKHPLTFFNRKDNNEYKVVIRTMTLRRDKEDPMMYHYNISMRGYDLTKGSDSGILQNVDNLQFQNNLLESLGLSGVNGSPLLGSFKEASTRAKGILGSVANGTNQLGR